MRRNDRQSLRVGGLWRRVFRNLPLAAFCVAAAKTSDSAGSDTFSGSAGSIYESGRGTLLRTSIVFSLISPERTGFYLRTHPRDTTPASQAYVSPEEFAPSLFDDAGGFQLRYADSQP